VTGGFLLDKSALARWSHPRVAAVLDVLATNRLLFSCAPIELEVRCSARSPREYKAMASDRSKTYEWVEMTSGAQALALEWQAVLAGKSHLRAVGVADLLIAATAAVHDLTVMHYDQDYEVLGRLCGAPHRYVVPLGSVD
jgi:predicted nucleic acid-binding protein